MPLIIASISEYANEYLEEWAKENNIDKEAALNAIISSVRRDAEGLDLLKESE